MKARILTLFFICACLQGQAQINFVLNPSFEKYDTCPNAPGEITYANYWSTIDSVTYVVNCAPAYINICGTGWGVAPINYFFNHYPRTGNGMVDIVAFTDQSYPMSLRSYAQGRLYTHLTTDKNYCVTFYVNLNGQSEYGVNNIGAYIDGGEIDTAVNTCISPQTQYTPQILETGIIADTIHWVKVQGSFTATGNERFITIGNFFDYAHTAHQINNPAGNNAGGAQYLIDDVSVIESDAVADVGHDTTIAQGDSAFIGPNEIALPYTWYIKGNPSPIDSGGGIWVKPDSTTTYIVAQDLCGVVTYDTVTVWVGNVGVGEVRGAGVMVFPNPVKAVVTVGGAVGTEFCIYNLVGQEVYRAAITNSKQNVDVSGLPSGLYLYKVLEKDLILKEGKLEKE